MSNRSINLNDALYSYLLDVSLREDVLARKLRAETAKMPSAGMQIAPEQGQFMALLVKLTGAKRIVEVGTFTGYSSLSMARALPKGGKITCCDVSKEFTDVARKYWKAAGVDKKIKLKLAPAMQTLEKLKKKEKGKVDLIFIDADKGNYGAYYEAALVLLRKGGLILVDNVLWSGSVINKRKNDADTKAIRALNKKIKADKRVEISMIPLGDGLTFARKR